MTRFEIFFKDPIYLFYKNHLYNYLVRRQGIKRLWGTGDLKKTLELGSGISPILNISQAAIRTDISWEAMAFLKARMNPSQAVRLLACDGAKLPFAGRSLETVICSEVLEHIEKDDEVLDEIARVLAPGGRFFLTCPVQEKYFGFDDEFVGHYRRYEVDDLIRRLSGKGFKEFKVTPLLGPLEKRIMEPVTRVFSLLRGSNKTFPSPLPSPQRGEGKGDYSPRPQRGRGKGEGVDSDILSLGIRALAWLAFPFYLALNYLLAFFVSLEARSVSPEKVVTVCIQCRKSN